MTTTQLKAKWENEKWAYSTKEIGDGVQEFAEDVFLSEGVFALKKGLNSTPIAKRRYEIKKEESKKGQGADFVIFVTSDIIIPVEVERYNNIRAGVHQIIQYQLDWDKRYGILTDGETWRFYNNNAYRSFSIYELIDETSTFLTFWKEYTKPDNYYLGFFEPPGEELLLNEIESIPVEGHRPLFFEDTTKLIQTFRDKLKLEDYFPKMPTKKEREKRATEITYAYLIQFILYKTLVDNDFDDYKSEYDKRLSNIHTGLKTGSFDPILNSIRGVANSISKNLYRKFLNEQDFIKKKLDDIADHPDKTIDDVAPWLDAFLLIKKYDFSNVRNEIFGYIYENYLKELYEEENKGQYFTDPAVVEYMLDELYYDYDTLRGILLKTENISIIDPSCGSGTFLYSAVGRILEACDYVSQTAIQNVDDLILESVFGLDISDFPLYLTEMSILMRMLPWLQRSENPHPLKDRIKVFVTKDSITEFLNTPISQVEKQGGLFEQAQNLEYDSFMRDEKDILKMKAGIQQQRAIPRRRFDYVIGNPPYIGYNECSKQGLPVFKLIKDKEVRLNNIYGVNLHSAPGAQKKYSPKPNLYAFFLALGIALLKEEGKLAYIIPQTLLTAGDLDVLRYHLAKKVTIEKIISFSCKMFVGRGILGKKPVPTSSLIIILKNSPAPKDHEVKCFTYLNADDSIDVCLENLRARKKINNVWIKQSELLKHFRNWSFIKYNKARIALLKSYIENSADLSQYYTHSIAERIFKSKFYFDKGLVFETIAVSTANGRMSEGSFELFKPMPNRFTTQPSGEYVMRKDIRIPHGSQGIQVFERQYKIIWSYMNYDRFRFVDRQVMINFNNVVISSDDKSETLYLVAILNSPISKAVFDSNLRNQNEKDILLGIKAIKEYIRVPILNADNQRLKDEIIKRTEEMFALEAMTFGDVVDFSHILVRKFDSIIVEKGKLLLRKGDKVTRCNIKGDVILVEDTIQQMFAKGLLVSGAISPHDLKAHELIDFELINSLKSYIDDLVFALYFGVSIKRASLDKAAELRKACEGSELYSMVNT
jgi:hypothetical protein